jgi:hypothetical protein
MRACGLLERTAGAIHVMDREGDNYDLLSELDAAQTRYVIRLSLDRSLVGEREKRQRRRRARAEPVSAQGARRFFATIGDVFDSVSARKLG